jgi:hypothetical protein
MKAENLWCPYCGGSVVLASSRQIYNRDYGWIYICENYNKGCDSYVGCHPGTTKPLGTLANPILRKKRNKAHLHFDRIWKQRIVKRREAYLLMRYWLDIPFERCHIGMLNDEECELLVKKVSSSNVLKDLVDAKEKYPIVGGKRC